MSVELSKELAERIRESGANAWEYAKSPIIGGDFFVNTPHKNELKVWQGENAEIDIHISKTHRQAVLNIVEPDRILTRKSTEMAWGSSGLQGQMNSRNNLFAPVEDTKASTKILSTKWEITKAKQVHPGGSYEVKVEHQLEVPGSDMSLLVGIDEVAHFICGLPEQAESVKHAHELLKPKNVKAGTTRQGEWFFTEVMDEELIKELNDTMVNKIRRAIDRPGGNEYKVARLEKGSSHIAQTLVTKGKKTYVTGIVTDKRTTRHEPLIFSGWHEVVRNKEVESERMIKLREEGRSVTWD